MGHTAGTTGTTCTAHGARARITTRVCGTAAFTTHARCIGPIRSAAIRGAAIRGAATNGTYCAVTARCGGTIAALSASASAITNATLAAVSGATVGIALIAGSIANVVDHVTGDIPAKRAGCVGR